MAGVLLRYKDWRGARDKKECSGGEDDNMKPPARGGIAEAFTKPSARGGVLAAFRKSLSNLPISDNEFHAHVDPARKSNKKTPGIPSQFSACVRESARNIIK